MPKSSVQRTLTGLAIALLLEALVLYIATGASIWALFTGDTTSVVTGAALAAMCLGVALWLTSAARAITKGKRWARSAGIFWQLMQITISFGLYEVNILAAVGVALASGAVLITLFTKDVVAATGQSRD
ncbi:MAG: hypothetical protein ACOYKO_02950 [Rhodoluna sp.]